MNILSAYILGFTFSFGWTPCVGPILASVLIMVSSVEDSLMGYILIGVYTLGFTLPFIMVSLFYKKLYKSINKIKENINIIKKIGGIILIITGIIMSYNGFKTLNTKEVNIKEESNIIDFSVIDQYENVHTLSEYKGKTIFLNFWATWCPPCREEMPDIQSIYEEYGLNKDDVIILGVVSPNYGREEDVDYIKKFIDENNYTFPILFDYNGVISSSYNVSSMPTTFIINKDGYMSKYVPGAMDKDTMIFLIENER
jgi:cytochrome c-type biogenesis protein